MDAWWKSNSGRKDGNPDRRERLPTTVIRQRLAKKTLLKFKVSKFKNGLLNMELKSSRNFQILVNPGFPRNIVTRLTI